MYLIKVRVPPREFVAQCTKYGWEDGEDLPHNMLQAFESVAERYPHLKGQIVDSAHNEYRFECAEPYADDRLPEDETVELIYNLHCHPVQITVPCPDCYGTGRKWQCSKDDHRQCHDDGRPCQRCQQVGELIIRPA